MQKPNIVILFADDLGYGDVSCLNPDGRIPTPHIDSLARDGMVFTDAHSSSAVCSPSRYSLLTGRYNWRSPLQRGIVNPYGDPLIAEGRMTIASALQDAGYYTACIGKWHLGMAWDFDADEDFLPGGSPKAERRATDRQRQRWAAAFDRPTTGGPTTRGFDYYFGVDVPNWPPYCYIENDRTIGTPSEFLPARLFEDNLASLPGPAMPYWHFEQLLPTWAEKADAVIQRCQDTEQPFFLYVPFTSPHTPLSVNKPWIGKSGLDNLYADLVMETDHTVGCILESLEAHGAAENTLVLFASDNGCAPYIGKADLEAQGHYPSAQYRGCKSDIWDGGHRIPCLVRWPQGVAAGQVCDELICLSDMFATCMSLAGQAFPDHAGEDSFSLLPLLKGESKPVREYVVHHSMAGKFAIRDAVWKLVLCPGSGGWAKSDAEAAAEGLPLVQLYNMEADPGEKQNLEAQHPEKVRDMLQVLRSIVDEGRSNPGPSLANDVPVDIWKLDTMPSVSPDALSDY